MENEVPVKKTFQKVIAVDIDETICNTPDNPRRYEESAPIYSNIEKINRLYDEGYKIIYWTARGSLTGLNWFDLTEKQLKQWGCKYHELKCNKMFYDIIICDKALRIEEV